MLCTGESALTSCAFGSRQCTDMLKWHAVSSILLTQKCKEQLKEIFPAIVKRDFEDFQVIQSWFNNHNPFIGGKQLIALDTGVVDSENRATCGQAEEIGASIQKSLMVKHFRKANLREKTRYYH